MADSDPIIPLTPGEKAHYQDLAARGETPSLDIVRRFIATIRKTFNASPKAITKGKTTRNKKPEVTEDQIDFF